MRFCVAQGLVALQVELRVLEVGRVAGERRLGGLELDGERAGIDLDEHVALLDVLALLEQHPSMRPSTWGLTVTV